MAKPDKLKFFYCKHCGNLVQMVQNTGVPVVCCHEPMLELVANTADAAQEKHVPVAELENGVLNVCVGSVEHPMNDEHYIQFVCVETDCGTLLTYLSPDDAPKAQFVIPPCQTPLAVYEYCNLHGLWKLDLSAQAK